MKVIQTTEELLALFRARRVFHQVVEGERWKVGTRLGINPDCRLEPYITITWGYHLPAAMGAFSYTHSMLRPEARIGRYCSIGIDVKMMGDRHPLEWASSSPFSYDLTSLQGLRAYYEDHDPEGLTQRRPYAPPVEPVVIGNDVWIADDVMIARGVTVGDGAVIAARSLVLEDVPPYAVMVGSPARVQRLRFPERIVERLLVSRWWDQAPKVLDGLPLEDPERFLDAFEARLAGGAPPAFDPAPLTFEEITAVAPIIGEAP